MFNIKINEINTIKLVSGEEIIGKVNSIEENILEITKPLVIMMSPQGLAFGTFCPTLDNKNSLKINAQAVMTGGQTKAEVINEYTKATSSIKTPPKSSLIV